MCGAGLRFPQSAANPAVPTAQPQVSANAAAKPAAPPPAAAAEPLSGPSFLGLAEQPAPHSDVSYLLEDEPADSHRGRYLILLVMIAALAAAGWHWRGSLLAMAKPAGSGNTEAANTATPGTAPTSSEPAAATNNPVSSPGAPAQPSPQSSPEPSAAPPAASPAPAASTTTPPSLPPASDAPLPSKPPAEAPSSGAADSSASAPPKQPLRAKPSPATKATNSDASASSGGDETDALEAQGEKYLYGNGVSQNCARAQKSLLAAATRYNAKAQSVLGTMYATGHCATRDLPVAYRWFARALRHDPNNSRIQDDLKVLWGQMSAQERQAATQSD